MVRNLTKSDLKTGDVVVSKGGWQGVVLRGTACGDVIKWFKNEYGEIIQKYRSLCFLNNDLTYGDTKIVKVYRCNDARLLTSCDVIQDRFLLWEETVKEMTVAEIERVLGHKVKIVK